MPSGALRQVLHGCRQLVCEMWVKSRNEREPLVLVCQHVMVGTPGETAGDKPEEGGGRRQVIMALTSRATHVLQWRIQRAAIPRGGANLTKYVVVRIGVCNSTP